MFFNHTGITQNYVSQFSDAIQTLGLQLQSQPFDFFETTEIAATFGNLGNIMNKYIADLHILDNVDLPGFYLILEMLHLRVIILLTSQES